MGQAIGGEVNRESGLICMPDGGAVAGGKVRIPFAWLVSICKAPLPFVGLRYLMKRPSIDEIG